MGNFDLQADEVVLYEGSASSNQHKGRVLITLTSQRIFLEQEKGIFKKERELVDVIELVNVKYYNNTAQIKQKNNQVTIQTTAGNISFAFLNLLDARKFTSKSIDATTGTTLAERVSGKAKSAFEKMDETLGLDTRDTIKNVLEQGVAGVIFNGIRKKK